jgi:hypothetical protein
MVSTDDGFFVDVCFDWPRLVEELQATGYAFAADADPLSPEDDPPPSLRGRELTQALERWTEENWGPHYENLPSRERLLTLAREEVSPNTRQDHVRKLRQKYAPQELKKGGAPLHRR